MSVTVREVYVQEDEHVTKGDRLLRTSDGENIKVGVSGEVDKLHVEKDEEVVAEDALIDIVDFEHMVIEVKVDEFDVPAVTVGKAAQVTINALGVSFDTTVTCLDRLATQSGDISYYIATETVMDKSRTPLTKWFLAIYFMGHDKKRGCSALKLKRELKIAYDTA